MLVGGFIILVNARTLFTTWIENTSLYPYLYAIIFFGWLTAIVFTVNKLYRTVAAKETKQSKIIGD